MKRAHVDAVSMSNYSFGQLVEIVKDLFSERDKLLSSMASVLSAMVNLIQYESDREHAGQSDLDSHGLKVYSDAQKAISTVRKEYKL